MTSLNHLLVKTAVRQSNSTVIIDCEGINYLDDDIRTILNEYRQTPVGKQICISLHPPTNILVRDAS